MTDKEFKTIDEQLEILKQRGLTIFVNMKYYGFRDDWKEKL